MIHDFPHESGHQITQSSAAAPAPSGPLWHALEAVVVRLDSAPTPEVHWSRAPRGRSGSRATTRDFLPRARSARGKERSGRLGKGGRTLQHQPTDRLRKQFGLLDQRRALILMQQACPSGLRLTSENKLFRCSRRNVAGCNSAIGAKSGLEAVTDTRSPAGRR